MTSLTATETELFAVARNNEPINDDATPDIVSARGMLTAAEDGMRSAGLEPDLHLVTVTRKVSFGRPKRYDDASEPESVIEEAEEQASPAPGE